MFALPLLDNFITFSAVDHFPYLPGSFHIDLAHVAEMQVLDHRDISDHLGPSGI